MRQPSRFSRGLSEIVLIVNDVPKSARYYREVVGLVPNTEPNEEWAWFWAGPPTARQRVAIHKGPLLFEEHSPRSPDKRWGTFHYAFEVARADLMWGKTKPSSSHSEAAAANQPLHLTAAA